jgi:hypothetical protein
MNSKETINHVNSLTDLQILSDLLQTETRVSVLAAISKRIKALTFSVKSDEKKVKIKYQGQTLELLESEYLSAKEYYGDNYPAELISE